MLCYFPAWMKQSPATDVDRAAMSALPKLGMVPVVSEARSDWAPDPQLPPPKFSPPRRVPHGITLIGRPFDEGTVAEAGLALERVRSEWPRCALLASELAARVASLRDTIRAWMAFGAKAPTGSYLTED